VVQSVSQDLYDLVVARPAARAIAEHLPEVVSAAVIEFITGALIEDCDREDCDRSDISSVTNSPAFTAHAEGRIVFFIASMKPNG